MNTKTEIAATAKQASVQEGPAESQVELASQPVKHQVVIVGGGAAGISVAAQLTKGWGNRTDVAIIDPAEHHYYQPAWTLVGGGAFRRDATRRTERSVIPRRAHWIQDAVVAFDPERRRIVTRGGTIIEYELLVVAAGIQINWDQIKGLREAIGHDGVCSNYSFETVSSTWESIRKFKGGTAIFTQPSGAIKCGGAPQKVCYLADDYFRKSGVRDQTRVVFAAAGASIFAVDKYRATLEKVVARREIDTMFGHNLTAISSDTKEAIFENVETGEEVSVHYDMIHVTPPMGPPDFIARSPLADADGWVDVDQHTLRHRRYPNIFGLGDSSSLPTSKTAAAIRKQSPVVTANVKVTLQALAAGTDLEQLSLPKQYDGYTSCPVVTGYGSLVLAEFDYDKNPTESFPFDQSKERWSMWLLKKYGLPLLYWKGMLKGRA